MIVHLFLLLYKTRGPGEIIREAFANKSRYAFSSPIVWLNHETHFYREAEDTTLKIHFTETHGGKKISSKTITIKNTDMTLIHELSCLQSAEDGCMFFFLFLYSVLKCLILPRRPFSTLILGINSFSCSYIHAWYRTKNRLYYKTSEKRHFKIFCRGQCGNVFTSWQKCHQ